MIFVPLVALLVSSAAGIVEVQETSTAKNMKEEKEDEDNGGEEVFHNVARADSVVEEKEEIGEDRDSCKIQDTTKELVCGVVW